MPAAGSTAAFKGGGQWSLPIQCAEVDELLGTNNPGGAMNIAGAQVDDIALKSTRVGVKPDILRVEQLTNRALFNS